MKYIAILEDIEGTQWVYEGTVQGSSIWVKESEAHPLLLTQEEATEIANRYRMANETPMVKRA